MSELFTGATYDPVEDDLRLVCQLERVFGAMSDGLWRTLAEIEDITKDPPASISAQLRHLRKPRFGSYVVEKRPRGLRSTGLYEYRILAPGTPSLYASRPKAPAARGGFVAGLMYAARVVLLCSDIAEAKKRLREELLKAATKGKK